MLERDLLPTGVLPLTAITTTVTLLADGEPEHATLRDGRTRRLDLAQLTTLVSQTTDPATRGEVHTVTVHLDAPLLRRHPVDLVDTPGTGSIHAHNTADAQRALPTMDAAIVVLGADPPVTDAEQQLLTRVHELAVRTFVVLNKATGTPRPNSRRCSPSPARCVNRSSVRARTCSPARPATRPATPGTPPSTIASPPACPGGQSAIFTPRSAPTPPGL